MLRPGQPHHWRRPLPAVQADGFRRRLLNIPKGRGLLSLYGNVASDMVIVHWDDLPCSVAELPRALGVKTLNEDT